MILASVLTFTLNLAAMPFMVSPDFTVYFTTGLTVGVLDGVADGVLLGVADGVADGVLLGVPLGTEVGTVSTVFRLAAKAEPVGNRLAK